MFDRIELFRMAQAMAVHAGARQGVTAENVANADTPGFRARDIAPFAETYRAAGDGLRATRAGHLGAGVQATFSPRDAGGEASPNGNNVSIETEMLRAAEIRGQHDRALAIYRSGMTILRATLGR
ncbi:MAG: FlgB family protein [Rhodobacteraceae bacterium]|nr:FlgB family protein [Paracoccaceae bacterium]